MLGPCTLHQGYKRKKEKIQISQITQGTLGKSPSQENWKKYLQCKKDKSNSENPWEILCEEKSMTRKILKNVQCIGYINGTNCFMVLVLMNRYSLKIP